MMYIIRQSDKDIANKRTPRIDDMSSDREAKSYNWHVGDPRPTDGNIPFEDVVEVYADGHELEYIQLNYTNLPCARNTGCNIWRNDFAQFIYDHLPTFARYTKVDETSHFRSEG